MKRRNIKSMTTGLVLAVFFSVLVVCSGPGAAEETTGKEIRQEMADVAEAIKDYSAERRDEAVQKAQDTLAELDARIERLENRSEQKWDEMDKSVRQKKMDSLKALRKKRNEVAYWLGSLQYSSTSAWEEVKKGFSKSYKALGEAFGRAEKEF